MLVNISRKHLHPEALMQHGASGAVDWPEQLKARTTHFLIAGSYVMSLHGEALKEGLGPAGAQLDVDQFWGAVTANRAGFVARGACGDHFFEAGGSSMQVIEMLTTVTERFGKEIDTRSFCRPAASITSHIGLMREGSVAHYVPRLRVKSLRPTVSASPSCGGRRAWSTRQCCSHAHWSGCGRSLTRSGGRAPSLPVRPSRQRCSG